MRYFLVKEVSRQPLKLRVENAGKETPKSTSNYVIANIFWYCLSGNSYPVNMSRMCGLGAASI